MAELPAVAVLLDPDEHKALQAIAERHGWEGSIIVGFGSLDRRPRCEIVFHTRSAEGTARVRAWARQNLPFG